MHIYGVCLFHQFYFPVSGLASSTNLDQEVSTILTECKLLSCSILRFVLNILICNEILSFVWLLYYIQGSRLFGRMQLQHKVCVLESVNGNILSCSLAGAAAAKASAGTFPRSVIYFSCIIMEFI